MGEGLPVKFLIVCSLGGHFRPLLPCAAMPTMSANPFAPSPIGSIMRLRPSNRLARSQPAPRSGVRNFMQQGEQRKLLALVLLLGLAFFSISAVGQQRSWAWFTYLTDPNVEKPVNTRLDEKPLPNVLGAGDVVLLAQNDTQNLNLPATVEQPAKPGEVPLEAGIQRLFPGVTAELLAPIRHDAPFSPSEHKALTTLLDILNQTPEQDLASFARQSVPYVQLYSQPEVYCGELVHVKGLLRSAYSDLKLAKNDVGISTYSQLWISPSDRSKHEVFSAYVLDLPADFPRGETAKGAAPGEVELTGFYFKRWAYRAKDGNLRSTPLLLAKTATWRPAPPPEEPEQMKPEVVAQDMTIAVVTSLAICGFMVWYVMRRRTPSLREQQLMSLASRRQSGRAVLDDLRGREVSPEVLSALGKSAPSSHSRTDPS